VAAEAAARLARVALAVLDAALPGLAAAHGAALAAEFARRLAPMLDASAEARILVAPDLAQEVRALLGGVGVTVAEDAALAPGDARAEWRAGGAALDLAARRREIRGVLQAAGLGLEE
jgi:flagellar biosynthesis/type III secretory pathway protein FliH